MVTSADAVARMQRIQAEVQALVDGGKPVPRTLELKLLYALAAIQKDPKETKDTYRQIALLRAKDAKAGITAADVPKEVLMKIAEFKAKGITPYSPAME